MINSLIMPVPLQQSVQLELNTTVIPNNVCYVKSVSTKTIMLMFAQGVHQDRPLKEEEALAVLTATVSPIHEVLIHIKICFLRNSET